jgi:hypothetical protein
MALKLLLKITKPKKWKGGKFPSGPEHPKAVPWRELERKIDALKLNGLTVLKGTYQTINSHRFIDAVCNYCKEQKRYHVDALLRGLTTGCMCQRNLKYRGDPRAKMLGLRYDCMVQRCYRESHKQHKDYKGKGITVLFDSREHFVRWALETFPDTDFKGLEFHRVVDLGPYSPDNLILLTSHEHHLLRADNVFIEFKGERMHWAEWPSPYAPRKTQCYAAEGHTGESIIQLAITAVKDKRKNWQGISARLAKLGYADVE